MPKVYDMPQATLTVSTKKRAPAKSPLVKTANQHKPKAPPKKNPMY